MTSYITEIRFDSERNLWVACNKSGPVMVSRLQTNLTSRYPTATVIEEKS